MYQSISPRMYVAAFIVLWASSSTIRFKVQGTDMIPTRHRQCQNRGFDTACAFKHGVSNSCIQLKCGRSTPDGHFMPVVIEPSGGVAKGTKCGEGKICIDENCVDANPMVPTCVIGDDIFSKCRPAQPLILAYTRTEQCKRRGFAGACESASTSCEVLHCARRHPPYYFLQKVIPLWGTDIGTKCGENKICINRECVNVVGEMPLEIGGEDVHKCIVRIMPWMSSVKTRHEQCKDHGYDVACKDEQRTPNGGCHYIHCGYKTLTGYYIKHPTRTYTGLRVLTASGTACGESRICQKTKCVGVEEEYIPRYVGDDIYHTCDELNRL